MTKHSGSRCHVMLHENWNHESSTNFVETRIEQTPWETLPTIIDDVCNDQCKYIYRHKETQSITAFLFLASAFLAASAFFFTVSSQSWRHCACRSPGQRAFERVVPLLVLVSELVLLGVVAHGWSLKTFPVAAEAASRPRAVLQATQVTPPTSSNLCVSPAAVSAVSVLKFKQKCAQSAVEVAVRSSAVGIDDAFLGAMIAYRLIDANHRGELVTAVKKSTSGVMSEGYIARYGHIERVVVLRPYTSCPCPWQRAAQGAQEVQQLALEAVAERRAPLERAGRRVP